MSDREDTTPEEEREEERQERWTSTPAPPARGTGDALPPPPPEPSFAEQFESMSDEDKAPPPQAPPPQAPPPQAPPPQAPPPQAPPSQAPPEGEVGPSHGFAGPEFTALRDKPMEIVDEEDEDEEDEDGAPKPPRKAAPTNVAAEWKAAAPGSHKAVLAGRINVKRLGLIVLACVLAFVGFRALLPKPPPGQDLGIAFSQGAQARYRVFVTYKGTRTLPSGKAFPVSTNLHATADLTVAEVSGDVATLDVEMTNVFASGPSPFVKQVPSAFSTQIQVGRDGQIRSGQFGLANAMIGYLAPGWDLLFPMLPPETVQGGDTWNTSEDVPVTADVTVGVRGESTLTGTLDADTDPVAVVTGSLQAPVQAEVPLAAVADAIGVKPEAYGLPPGANPTLAFDGDIDLDLTASIDPAAGELKGMYLHGDAKYAVVAKGIPGLDKKHESAQIAVTMSVRINQQAPGAKPDAEG